jgi:hypothetical protein
MLVEAMSLLPDTACTIHSIPIISKATATMKFKSTMPTNGDAKTINDTATANTPTPINNDLEPFDTCFDSTPSTILAIPANNRLMPSIITKNPAANNGKARTPALNPITKAPRIMFPAREDFDWFAENPVAILSIPITISATARATDKVAIPTLGYTITESDNPTAITPSPICKNLSHDGGERLNALFTSMYLSSAGQI